jgi:hypothetical protein
MQDAMLAEAIQAGMEIDGRRRSEAPASNVGPSPPFPPPALDFFQTPTHVTANYYIRGATQQNCEVRWTTKTLAVVRMLSSRDGWKRSDTSEMTLYADVEECTVRYMAKKVEVKLKKRVAGVMWNSLEKMEASARQVGADNNWDGIGRFCVCVYVFEVVEEFNAASVCLRLAGGRSMQFWHLFIFC